MLSQKVLLTVREEMKEDWTREEDPAIEEEGIPIQGTPQQASCLESLIVSMHLLIVALI